MTATIQKWGNSLAVRIPKSLAGDADLICGSAVNMTVRDGGVFIVPAKKISLDDVVNQLKKKKNHKCEDWGSVGVEVW